jgi:hypothetical protein
MPSESNSIAVPPHRYWVVGGCYETLSFDQLVEGTGIVCGPFLCQKDAETAWRGLSENSRWQATVRFTIACEPREAS